MINLPDPIMIDDERLTIYQDIPFDPRKEKHLGHIVCWADDYEFGDNSEYPWEGPWGLLDELCPLDQLEDLHCTLGSWEDIVERLSPGIIVYELYSSWTPDDRLELLLDHDTKSVGCTYVTKDEIIAEYGEYNETTKKLASDKLYSELDEYNHYLQDDKLGYRICRVHKCSECGHIHNETLDNEGGLDCLEDIVDDLKERWYEFAMKLQEVLENDQD